MSQPSASGTREGSGGSAASTPESVGGLLDAPSFAPVAPCPLSAPGWPPVSGEPPSGDVAVAPGGGVELAAHAAASAIARAKRGMATRFHLAGAFRTNRRDIMVRR